MGHKLKAQKKREVFAQKFEWPWELSIDIGVLDPPRICFLSGQERGYFPEDPGHSRHGVEYSMNCHPGDTPNPNYLPSDDRLQKPISLLGYGIGGLSAPRFPKELNIHTPEPNSTSVSEDPTLSARPSLVQAPPKSVAEPDFVAFMKRLAGKATRDCEKRSPPLIAFGSSRKIPRFGKVAKWQCVGTGHYDVSNVNLCKKLGIMSGFGRGPVRIVPPTDTECSYENLPQCIECENTQTTRDYYKSLKSMPVPRDRHFLSEEAIVRPKSAANDEVPMLSPRTIYMCRKCFCRIMRDGHSFWRKTDLVTKFQKTRHCVNIHEHNDLPVFTHKVSCKLLRSLSRKEALMIRYFDDSCPKKIKDLNATSQSQKKNRWGVPT